VQPTGKVIVDHRRGKDLTGLVLKLPMLGSSHDTHTGWDNFRVNEPWNWGPEHSFLTAEARKLDTSATADTHAQGLHGMPPPPAPTQPRYVRKVVPATALESEDDPMDLHDMNGWDSEQQSEAKITNEQLMLMYPLTFAFSLKSKKWGRNSPTQLNSSR
jgi:hypothetical protein